MHEAVKFWLRIHSVKWLFVSYLNLSSYTQLIFLDIWLNVSALDMDVFSVKENCPHNLC